jgi:hypothetical protein
MPLYFSKGTLGCCNKKVGKGWNLVGKKMKENFTAVII